MLRNLSSGGTACVKGRAIWRHFVAQGYCIGLHRSEDRCDHMSPLNGAASKRKRVNNWRDFDPLACDASLYLGRFALRLTRCFILEILLRRDWAITTSVFYQRIRHQLGKGRILRAATVGRTPETTALADLN